MLLTKTNLERMDEATLRQNVIMPLLEKMGFKDIAEKHGIAELGKDIVCWKSCEPDGRDNLAIVAKAEPLRGEARAAQTVAAQVAQCFNEAYKNPVNPSDEQRVHKVWVISNKKITEPAQTAIKSTLNKPELIRYITFIDKDKLWSLVKQYMPISLMAYAQELQERVRNADSHYEPHLSVSGDKINMMLVEKYPGAAKEKPLTFKPYFVSAEAEQQFKLTLMQYEETGQSMTIPPALFERFEIPEFLQGLMGCDNLQLQELRLLARLDERQISASLRIKSNANEVVFSNVNLKVLQAGSKQVKLVNDELDVPFKIEMLLDSVEQTIQLEVSQRDAEYNAVKLKQWLNLLYTLSDAFELEITNNDTGIPLFSGQSFTAMSEEPDPNLVLFIEKLSYIQTKMCQQIVVPFRAFEQDEIEMVLDIYNALTNPMRKLTWTDARMELTWNADIRSKLENDFGDHKFASVVMEREETHFLFNATLPMGLVRRSFPQVKLSNFASALSQSENGHEGTIVELNLSPGEDATCEEVFLNWM